VLNDERVHENNRGVLLESRVVDVTFVPDEDDQSAQEFSLDEVILSDTVSEVEAILDALRREVQA
jgi:hypothetical protein